MDPAMAMNGTIPPMDPAMAMNNGSGASPSVIGSMNGPAAMINFTEIDCYSPFMIITNGIWLGDDPFRYSLPLLLIQMLMVTLTTRALYLILKPLRQPIVLAEILSGMVLGPSILGMFSPDFETMFFPPRSIITLASLANLGLLYFVFIVGVEMDMNVMKQMGKKVLAIGTASIVFPFAVTITAAYLLRHQFVEDARNSAFYVYLGIALSVTAFPVLARVLSELKLLSSEIGRISLSSSIINDLLSWILLAVTVALTGAEGQRRDDDKDANAVGIQSHYILLSGLAFVIVCVFVIQPAVSWLVRQTPEGEPMSDMHLGIILMGVMAAGLVTDFIGIHSIFGAFIYGLIVPNGPYGTALVERLEDFVTGLLLPLYFATSGLRTELSAVEHRSTVLILVFVFVLSSIAKVVATILIALYYNMPLYEGISLGFLMNTKGLIEVIILNVARDKKIMDKETYALMVVMSTVTMALVTPVVVAAYKPSRRIVGYKRRHLMRAKPDSELRMLVCVHTGRNVPSVVSLLDVSNPTKRSPIFVYALHLVELTGRASAMLIVHNTGTKSDGGGGRRNANRSQAQSEHIISAFETYEQHAGGVSVQSLTAISPYSTMHEDICSVAEDKRTTIIIIPFHKLQTVDGGMEAPNPAIRTVNQNVLNHAPCSVAILVDRGLSTGKAGRRIAHHLALLFFGGPDDREALAYAWRMAEHPNTSLTVVRFIPGAEAAASPSPLPPSSETNDMLQQSRVINIGSTEVDRERAFDDEYVSEFRLKNLSDESIVYVEKVVNNSEETVGAIRSIDGIHDLYVVGRSQGLGASSLTAGLTEWTECPELGPIGDLLASMDFGATVSVLVVQQYVGAGAMEGRGGGGGGEETALAQPDSPGQLVQQYVSRANHRVRGGGRSAGAFNSGWHGGP